jgi:hypothetical protein
MKNRIMSFVASAMLFASVIPAQAAPLFPDVKDDHWAKDAVAALAAKGLLEGYPDGTFKGDRAATRWEVAMIVARLLAKMEQANATFATKAELDDLRKLVNSLKDELDALGVRVTNLEEQVGRLDKRVTELERITFYGSVDARGTLGSFQTGGGIPFYGDNSNGGGVGKLPANGAGSAGPGYINYNAAIGSVTGAKFNPAVQGVLPVADFRNGSPLVNGVGFTMAATLGVRVRVTDDIDAGAEFAAFTSQGNQILGAYQGVSAPYLTNGFQSNTLGNGGANTGGNAPFTRMVLNDFWVVHNPSQTKLVIGAFNEQNMDPMIYSGQYNPNVNGPRQLGSYGFNLNGKTDITDAGVLRWEVLGTELPDWSGYSSYLIGADVEFEFEGGAVKANFAHVSQDGNAGTSATRTTGLVGDYNVLAGGTTSPGLAYGTNGLNVNYGATTGWTPLQWVNPSGYFVNQAAAGGSGSTTDNRPISGWSTGADVASGKIAGSGGFGPQSETLYGGSANYKFDLGTSGNQVYVAGNFGHSDYKPNTNSGYSVGGNAYRVEAGVNLLDGDLDIGVQYVSTDPNYDPYVLQYSPVMGTQGAMRLPDLNYFSGLYSLHDTSVYTQNRRGAKENVQYRFNDRRGLVWLKGAEMQQVQTSLYDVRVPGGSIGAAIPTNDVIGFAPGFMDAVFTGFAHPNIYGAGTANAFTAALQPLENPRGSYNMWGLGASYKFDDPRVKVEAGYENHSWIRSSALSPTFGGSQDQISLLVSQLHSQISWEASDKWTIRAGADWTRIRGHYDPAGLYNSYAIATGSSTFNNIDDDQISPYIGFDYDMSANTKWNIDARYYTTTSNTNVPMTLSGNAIGNTANPFNFNGWLVNTQFKVKF